MDEVKWLLRKLTISFNFKKTYLGWLRTSTKAEATTKSFRRSQENRLSKGTLE
jgi:hypothetical protein